MAVTIEEFLKEPTLFKALEFIGVVVEIPDQRSQRTGPIMFQNESGESALLLVGLPDHEMFDRWRSGCPDPTGGELERFACDAMRRLLDSERYKELNNAIAKADAETE